MFRSALTRLSSPAARLAPRVPLARTIVSNAKPSVKAAPKRSLATVAEASKLQRPITHVLDSYIATEWKEIPVGGINRGPNAAWKIWYNHAVVPIFVVIGAASVLCSYFMYRYFSRHVEIAWSKSVRMTADHTGADETRTESHANRLLYSGMRERNKKPVVQFPFNFIPMNSIIENRKIDYPDEA